MQHTARHERLDKLMGNDFKQYRANMTCGYDNCMYNSQMLKNKSSHFHCLKCEFICSDTNKVVAHRRQHFKIEYINSAGFRKDTSLATCRKPDSEFLSKYCSLNLKQTHYHCVKCDESVLSKAQIKIHQENCNF